jgi:hypothetical protein
LEIWACPSKASIVQSTKHKADRNVVFNVIAFRVLGMSLYEYKETAVNHEALKRNKTKI